MTRLGMQKGDKVHVTPIHEYGIVVKVRSDRFGVPLIDVTLQSGSLHVCREYELYTVDENQNAA